MSKAPITTGYKIVPVSDNAFYDLSGALLFDLSGAQLEGIV